MNLNKLHINLILSILFTTILWSQDHKVLKDSTKINDLEEVIISATRTQRQLTSLPLPAQIISSKEIKQSNTLRLNDILNEQTGIITVSDFGGGEGVQLQGLDAEYTLILIDGVPLVGRSAGTLDLSRITVGNIKQIEVVKGPSSSLYGSEALGGVINIITDTPKQGFKGAFDYRLGRFNTNDASLTASYRKDKFYISLFGNQYSSDGYDLVNDSQRLRIENSKQPQTVESFANYTLNPKIAYTFNDYTKMDASFRYYYEEQDNTAIIDSTFQLGKGFIKEWNLHTKLDHKFNDKWKSHLEFYATNYKAESYLNNTETQQNFDKTFFDQQLIRPELRTTYAPNTNHSFIKGIGATKETLNRTYFSIQPEFDSQYIYFQYDGNYFDKLNLIIGGRVDHHSQYGTQFSPKVASRYEFNSKWSIKASIGYGFKAPDFRQLYFDFFNNTVGYTVLGYDVAVDRINTLIDLGEVETNGISVDLAQFNNELKPENSIGYNLGIRYAPIQSLSFDLNIFRNDIDNLIDTRVIARRISGANIFSYYNVHSTYTQGLEFNTTWKPLETLKINAGYQYLFAKDKEVVDKIKNKIDGFNFARDPNTLETIELTTSDYFGLYNRSKHIANLKVYYSIPKWKTTANIRATYRSKYGISDSNGNGYLDTYDNFVKGYSIIDLAINKQIQKYITIGAGIDNLFNTRDTENIPNLSGHLWYGTLKINY